MRLDQATPEQLREWQTALNEQYKSLQQAGLNLDLTRGKPSAEQLDLSNALDGILNGTYTDDSGTDLRNYGGLDGIPEAKQLFAQIIDVKPEEVMIGGNGSLTLMYFAVQTALQHGVADADSAWIKESAGASIKFLAPVPGYDRHFALCEHLGIELIPVTMNADGPDMDQVEQLVKADSSIKGIWCVPRFSNPTGTVYSEQVVQRIAKLGTIAGANFRVFWDNAYAVHTLQENATALPNLMDYCRAAGTEDSVYLFGSTSKITFAGAGVAFMASSPANLNVLKKHLSFNTIGPDKVNQLRHVKFLKDMGTLNQHMAKHAAIMQPRFNAVLTSLRTELGDSGMGSWTEPEGGYFVSFDSRPGLAREIVKMAAGAGVKLTPAGATFPYGNDPQDSNIRLAPTYPTVAEIEKAMAVFVLCVKLASINQALAA
ncbi:aminotransferase class I/II-fold pyridoxal phosphate-dependent enzyme [Oceanicoccus sp. KOV_DT_Chl]|uniref:aminotransferase class I/II-fold pyridoxal phosphate-dependent enzyme n=1 Tax=Oceanicoccus sp. KOV_DT_Chl TaxID=1904639 RepID=UPI000C7BD68E|nr:aminotransferase class I/II-fold pyridoxal phosphate-dependent enzyme [Oceanicoccus sp. KOV_DT_Chl]